MNPNAAENAGLKERESYKLTFLFHGPSLQKTD